MEHTPFKLESKHRQDLVVVIVRRLQTEERRQASHQAGLFGAVALVSFGGTISLGDYTYHAMSSSGFLQFSSLALSDWQVVTAHLSDYALSLLESLPIVEVALFLAVALVFVGSMAFVISDFRIIRSSVAHA